MGTREIKRYCAVKEDAERLLETAINKLGLRARAYSRVLKVGRTIADLAGRGRYPSGAHRRGDSVSELGPENVNEGLDRYSISPPKAKTVRRGGV
jgi:hypothetical protein